MTFLFMSFEWLYVIQITYEVSKKKKLYCCGAFVYKHIFWIYTVHISVANSFLLTVCEDTDHETLSLC